MSERNTDLLKKSKMSLIGVLAIIFSLVAAGAFGIEEAIASSGPGTTILMLVIFPFIWAFPLCEMVGELGALLPTEGGIYSWGREAFGEFWGWQVGLWSALTTWLCQAEYCALVAGYAAKLVDLSDAGTFAVKVAVVIIFTIVNIIGLDWLERLETFFTVLVVIAFSAVTIVGLMNWTYNPMMPLFNPDEGALHSVGEGVAIIIWMYMGYECMSNMAEEMDDPQLIPKAMRLSQPIIALSYILPTLAALAAIGSWDAWSTEQGGGAVGYADVLIQHVGSWAGVMFIIIAIVSNCSIFCSYIAHGSRAFFVMADDHMFPPIMKKVDKRGIPTVSIILLAIFTIITCQFDFTTLVMATNPIQLYMYLMLVACVFKFRSLYPVEERRKLGLTVMPGGKAGLWFCSLCVILVSLFAIYVNGTDYFVTGFVVIFGGLIAYVLCKWAYKGRALDDPQVYPLNPKTKLDLGDLMNVGSYLALSGALSFGAGIFLNWYEGEYGVEYYLEENETGLLSNFSGMITLCLVLGAVMIIGGIIMMYVGKKTEGPELEKLEPIRKKKLDEMIEAIHGALPDGKS